MYNHYISQVVTDKYVLYLMLLPVNETCIYTYTYIFIPLSYNTIIGFAVFRIIYYI